MKSIGLIFIIGWVLRIGILLVGIFIFAGVGAFLFDNSTPPSPDKAEFAIQTYSEDGQKTPSRVYYANEIVYDGNLPVIEEYWVFDGEDYKQVKKQRIFTEPIRIVRRVR